MSQNTVRGFVPCRKLDGGPAIHKTFRVSAGDSIAYFIGDAVTLGSTGRVSPVRTSAEIPTGVITALQKVVGGKPSPLTFTQPSRGPYLATAEDGFATVCIGLSQTFLATIDKNITEADFGAGARVSAGAPNTAAGLSGHTLQGVVTTSANDAHFQIIGFAPIEMLETRTSAASPVVVEVVMNRNTFDGNLI